MNKEVFAPQLVDQSSPSIDNWVLSRLDQVIEPVVAPINIPVITMKAPSGTKVNTQELRQTYINKTGNESLAFDAQLELDAITRMPYDQWQQRVDRMLQAYVLEHVVEEDITYYDLKLSRDEDGNVTKIFAPGFEDSETGDIEESFARAKGRRVAAENLGFHKIKEFVTPREAIGRFFVRLSPPGTKEEGFPGHSFAVIGRVMEDRLEIVAYRNWLAVSEQTEFLNRFLSEENQLAEDAQDVDLLQAPVFLPRELGVNSHMGVIRMLDSRRFALNNNDSLLTSLAPYRQKVIKAMRFRNKAEIVRAMNAHENFARAYLNGEVLVKSVRGDVVRGYDYYASYAPPLTKGSCGKGGVFFNSQFSSKVESLSLSNSGSSMYSTRSSGFLRAPDYWSIGQCDKCPEKIVGPCDWCMKCEQADFLKGVN